MRRTAFVLALALGLASLASAQSSSFSSLEERMSAADFRAAGLEKLSPDELAALNAWLQRDAGTARPAMADRRGLEETTAANTDGPVDSRLIGVSEGWALGTAFRLENGQVWRSVDRDSRLSGVRLENPKVSIRKGLLGNWRLKFEGYNQSVKVEREE